jgi:hypothetical protein
MRTPPGRIAGRSGAESRPRRGAAEEVNKCFFPHSADFKRMFEVGGGRRRQIPAAFGLTDFATMLIRSASEEGHISCGKPCRR